MMSSSKKACIKWSEIQDYKIPYHATLHTGYGGLNRKLSRYAAPSIAVGDGVNPKGRFRDDCMDAGGRATQGAVADESW